MASSTDALDAIRAQVPLTAVLVITILKTTKTRNNVFYRQMRVALDQQGTLTDITQLVAQALPEVQLLAEIGAIKTTMGPGLLTSSFGNALYLEEHRFTYYEG